MEKFDFLKTQKNQIYEIINNSNLSPYSFSWDFMISNNNSDLQVPCITYNKSDYYFLIDKDYSIYEIYQLSFSPYTNSLYYTTQSFNWEDIISYFSIWLRSLESEINTRDLWEELSKYSIEAEIIHPESSRDEFTFREVKQITAGINEVREYLVSHVAQTENSIEDINKKLDYVIDSLERMNKFDWKNFFVGILVDLSIAFSFNPEQGHKIMSILKSSFGGLINFIQSNPNSLIK